MKFDLQRLKGERVARGITQAQMARKIGISTNAYWRKENGERDIGMEEFVKILSVLGFEKKQISLFLQKTFTIVNIKEMNK
ncbi:DNA-binding helix-turn-helix protein [Lactobacillus gasseri 224-1]|uniref:DNA-binding helix-turn-helix protein n=1 Tax=Lactobacillus gasseri 224-1 TaxID=679196 RepID=D1YIE6_LACGS|nr:DNA-binding helix-turn-helix protein [Lactobacillus gasseri 224-1]